MYFRLKCACGKEMSVAEGAAGVALACPCGRQVVVPELTELRRRVAAGEIGCSLRADGEKPAAPPSPLADASHVAFCWLLLVVGGLVAGAGVLLILPYGRLGYGIAFVGIAIMGLAARGLANRAYEKAARAHERQEYARLTGTADRSVGSPTDGAAETSVTDRPGKVS